MAHDMPDLATLPDLSLEFGGGAFPVTAASEGVLRILGAVPPRGQLRLVLRGAPGEVSTRVSRHSLRVDREQIGCSVLSIEGRVKQIVDLSRDDSASLCDWMALGEEGEPVPPRKATVGRAWRMSAGVVVLACAAALFAGAAQWRYGVARLVGSVQATDAQLVRAEYSGEFFPYVSGPHLLQPGELIGTINTSRGRSHAVASPCGCYLGNLPLNAGSTVIKGAVVARMIESGSGAEVVAALPPVENWQIAPGDPATVITSDGDVSGHVIAIETERVLELADLSAQDSSDGFARVRIGLDEPMAPEFFGSEVAVHIGRTEGLLARLTSSLN